MYPPILRVHLKKQQQKNKNSKGLSNDAYVMFFVFFVCLLLFFFSDFLFKSICCGYSFELQFKWVLTTYAFIKK